MQAEQLPLWIQYVSALGPTAVAASVAYVAWNQWRTAHAKVRFELFERRYKVYRAIEKIIILSTIEGQLLPSDLQNFYDDMRGSEFLFEDDLRSEAIAIGDMASRAAYARAGTSGNIDHPRYEQLIAEENEVLNYLVSRRNTLHSSFKKYLDLSRV